MTTHRPDPYCRECNDTGKAVDPGASHPSQQHIDDLERDEDCEECPRCEACDERIGGLEFSADAIRTENKMYWCHSECLHNWVCESPMAASVGALLSVMTWATSEKRFTLDCERGELADIADTLKDVMADFAEHLRWQASNEKGVVL